MTEAPLAAAPFVASMVDAIWQADATPGGIVLPDGSADLIFDGRGLARVVGVMSRARRMTAAARRPMFGVRLAPWAAHAVLGVAAHELRDTMVPVADVDRALAAALDGVASARDLALRLPALLGARREARPIDARVRRATALLVGGELRVDRVARAVALSERQLERLIQTHVGLGPKRLARIARLRSALAAANPGSLAAAAAAAGYADQAHFARDVRALTGVTARELMSEPASQRARAPRRA